MRQDFLKNKSKLVQMQIIDTAMISPSYLKYKCIKMESWLKLGTSSFKNYKMKIPNIGRGYVIAKAINGRDMYTKMNTVRAKCMLKDLKQIMTSKIRYKFEGNLFLGLDTQAFVCKRKVLVLK